MQRHAIIGALGFGAFSAFWTTLAFYLGNRPEHFDSQATGLFGLVGVAGALAAPISGRMSDRFEARIVNGAALALVVVSFLLMRLADYSLIWLVVGVFLMDAGVQASQISNQTRIYAISTELRNRINSVYMVCYFWRRSRFGHWFVGMGAFSLDRGLRRRNTLWCARPLQELVVEAAKRQRVRHSVIGPCILV